MHLFDVYPLFDINIVEGKACYTFDENACPYLDFYGGHAVISIGHSHPKYVKRIKEQVEKIGFYSNSVINKLQNEVAERLGALSGYDDYALFLVNSGAEANENAIKLASFHNARRKLIAFRNSFHGRTSAALSVTDNKRIAAPVNEGFDVQFLPLNDEAALEAALGQGDVCAVIIEGIQGVGGVQIPTDNFLKTLSKACRKHGAVLILDEIQSGYGRSGRFFTHQYAGIRPDIITMAKGMGNGFPIGGMLIHPRFEARKGMLGTTFGGNHLACAAAAAVLEVIHEEKLIENAEQVGRYLMKKLSQLHQIKEVRGRGLMIGLEFEVPVEEIRRRLLFEKKIFTGQSGTQILRLLPPLCLSKTEADSFVKALKAVLD